MRATSKAFRVHIGLFGRRNIGKSSLLNALARQEVAVVSPIAGTTTDPVEKPMELLPLGPVLFIDTAGVDDQGALGELRIHKTKRIFEKIDLALLITDQNFTTYERELLKELQQRDIPLLLVFNKSDAGAPSTALLTELETMGLTYVQVSALKDQGLAELRAAIISKAQVSPPPPPLLQDLVPPGELAILVIPIDSAAPKGRIILPQVQALRELLEQQALSLVVQPETLKAALARLSKPPALVVTDSQAFKSVASYTPETIPLTSFSILLARQKGGFEQQVANTLQISKLQPGDKILIAEACSHHPGAEDIGRVKIPRLLENYVKGPLNFTIIQGEDFPGSALLSNYRLVIHCGACMFTRRQIANRLALATEAGVPFTNYGLVISYTLGLFARVLSPFKDLHAVSALTR